MTISLKSTVRNAMLDVVGAALDAGSGAGKIRVYSGVRPTNADTALSGNTLLVEFALADPATEAASGGALPLDAEPDLTAVAVASGTATFYRALDSDNNVVMDGSVATSAADLNLSSVTITSGQSIAITSGNLIGAS
jgi:hypothetical protein